MRKKTSKEMIRKIRDLRDQGLSRGEIVERLGISLGAVRRWTDEKYRLKESRRMRNRRELLNPDLKKITKLENIFW